MKVLISDLLALHLAAAGALFLAAPVLALTPLGDPPGISEAEIEGCLAQYRQEMSQLRERERGREPQAEARLQARRSSSERHAAVRNLVAQADEAARPELGRFEPDWTAAPMLDVSLGMLQPAADAKAAAPGGPVAGHPNLAGAATNPLAALIQFQLQNNFVGESNAGSGYSNSFVVQPVIPFKLGDRQWISRITLPLVATADLGDPIGREYGLGDTVAFAVALFPIDKHGSMVGVGPAFTLPTATDDLLGEGKFQAGPTLAYVNTATPGFQWGVFGYQQWSLASSGGDSGRPEVSKLFFQPILTWHFAKSWYVSSGDILWSIDWNDNARWSIPLGVRLGHITKFGHMPVNVFVEPFYDVIGNNKGNEWGVKLNVTLLFPQG